MRGNRILERLTAQDCNTPHSCDYRYSVTIHHEDGTETIEHFPARNDVIILDPDVKKYFPNSESVNSTLRSLIKLIPQQ